VSAFQANTRDHFLFECTVNAAKTFADYKTANGSLRGCAVEARRLKATVNGKVTITVCATDLRKLTLPEPPDIILAMCVIWRLPTDAILAERARVNAEPRVQHIHANGKTIQTKRDPLDFMRNPLDNDADPKELAKQSNHRESVIAELQAMAGNGHKPGQPV
jgi:hypothetical protein